MVVNKRKKVTKYRGSHTHGGGSKKKRRGAGHRGGRGNAGSGKKGDCKKPSYEQGGKYLGKHGFTSKSRSKPKPINLNSLTRSADKGLIKKTGSTFTINLTEMGYSKLLGTGIITQKFEITVKEATQKAIQKVEKAGGKVILPKKETPTKEE
jgi:large subunit ribosomal protein L15